VDAAAAQEEAVVAQVEAAAAAVSDSLSIDIYMTNSLDCFVCLLMK